MGDVIREADAMRRKVKVIFTELVGDKVEYPVSDTSEVAALDGEDPEDGR